MGGHKALLWVAPLAFTACMAPTCVPGASQSCLCSDGAAGTEICQIDNSLGPCTCGSGLPGTAVIGQSGGTLALTDGTSVVIPPGALTHDLTITIQVIGMEQATPLPSDAAVVGHAYLFGPEGLQFAVPVTVKVALESELLPAGQSASTALIYTAPEGSSDYTSMATTVADSQHLKAQTTHFSVYVDAIPEAGDGGTEGDGGMDAGTDGGTDSGTTSGSTTGAGSTGTSSGGGGAGTTGGTGSGAGTGTGSSIVCPSVGAVGCGTLSIVNGPYGNYLYQTVYPVTLGTYPGPVLNVPAIDIGDIVGQSDKFEIEVALPSCPTAFGNVMESGTRVTSFQGATSPTAFTATVDFLQTDGGMAGIAGTIQSGSGDQGIISATFAFPASLGAGGLCVAPPCASSGDDGGAAAPCSQDGDCCEGNCVIDAGSTGLCQ